MVFSERGLESGQRLSLSLPIITLLLVAFLLPVVRPGAPSSVLAPSSDAPCY